MNKIEKVINYMSEIDLSTYWNGFTAVAYAIYNKEFVHLFNHPKFKNESEEAFTRLNWSKDFSGADTLILFADYPTAIINSENHKDIESIYSILIHELFHGYQFLKGENRFPNEVMGFLYPIIKENIELRNQERNHLFSAVMENDQAEKRKNILEFIKKREKRKLIIGEFIHYENLVETIEGPAWFLESLAKHKVSDRSFEEILVQYSDFLIEKKLANLQMRRSCYASGLFLCLILDEISPTWRTDFLTSTQSLYEYLKEYIGEELLSIEHYEISEETEEIFRFIKEKKETIFSDFAKQDGFKLCLEGPIKVISFDPMNIIYQENKAIHQSFVKVQIAQKEYLFQQPTLACFVEDFRNVTRFELFLHEKPTIVKNGFFINGIGEIHGKIQEDAHSINIQVPHE